MKYFRHLYPFKKDPKTEMRKIFEICPINISRMMAKITFWNLASYGHLCPLIDKIPKNENGPIKTGRPENAEKLGILGIFWSSSKMAPTLTEAKFSDIFLRNFPLYKVRKRNRISSIILFNQTDLLENAEKLRKSGFFGMVDHALC